MKKISLLLLLASSISYGDCSLSSVLNQLRPGAQWVMSNNDPSKLLWISTDSVAPTLAEIQAGITSCQATEAANKQNLQNDISVLTAPGNKTPFNQALIDLLQQKGLLQ